VIAVWNCLNFGSNLLCVRTETLTHAARWHILLCAVFCLLAILPFGYAQSITELKSKAEDGDVQAQLALAKAYHLGEGIEKDEAQAVQWWEKAAEHGNVSAQVSLGSVYSLGAGVPKNYAAAVRWWKKAAEQGDVTAEGNLGTAYGLGMGVPKDEVESVRWHTKAAENGNAASQFSLGMFYLQGAGVPKDEAEGVKWLRKSADQGNAAGQFWLGASYYSGTGVAKDAAEALRWYRKAGDQGYAAAQYNLGQAYSLGNGVEKDPAEAARWWQKAAEQGMAKAQYNLGMAYRAGAGVEKDNLRAYFWIAIAASSLEQGFVKDYRDKVEAVLTPAQLADVQERIRKFEEAHPATQTASLNSLPSVPQAQQQTQAQEHPLDQQQARTQDQLKPVFLITNCTLKSGSVILSAFKEALQSSKRYELVPDLSDKGKMDVVIRVKMICVEDKGNVAVASIYGLAKCFGPKNCHLSSDDTTLNALLSEPGDETQSGINLFKGFDEDMAKSKDQMILNH
jgi:TPR repeat protein